MSFFFLDALRIPVMLGASLTSYRIEDCEWFNRKKQKFEAWESTIYWIWVCDPTSFVVNVEANLWLKFPPAITFVTPMLTTRGMKCVQSYYGYCSFHLQKVVRTMYHHQHTYYSCLCVAIKGWYSTKRSSIHNINYRCNLPLLASGMLLAGSMSITHGKFLLSF